MKPREFFDLVVRYRKLEKSVLLSPGVRVNLQKVQTALDKEIKRVEDILKKREENK